MTPLRLQFDQASTFQLVEPFTFVSDVLQVSLVVPIGFVTDFASVPRPLWSLLPPTGPYAKAAVVHDYLYRTKGVGSVLMPWRLTRRQADDVLLEGMRALRVNALLAWMVYVGVRVGGGPAWRRYRQIIAQ